MTSIGAGCRVKILTSEDPDCYFGGVVIELPGEYWRSLE